MVKRCPNCGAVITVIGEGDSVICWYCNQSLVVDEEGDIHNKDRISSTH